MQIKLRLVKIIAILSVIPVLFSCQGESALNQVHGDVKVQVPDLSVENHKMRTVVLKSLTSLESVSGDYVQFYYSPGAQSNGLTGDAPKARFARNTDGVYTALDSLSLQMATIYYHIQNLKDHSVKLDASLNVNQAMSVGINTLTAEQNEGSINNAFFDGETQALLFVPYDLKGYPISVNGGIIAHEYFHSIFYKLFFNDYYQKQTAELKIINDPQVVRKLHIDLTLVRGLNEGLADFWGWVYSSQEDYIPQSLIKVGDQRSLAMGKPDVGFYQTDEAIQNQVIESDAVGKNSSEYLASYSYKIGTPYARFLKRLVDLSDKPDEAKQTVAIAVIQFVKSLNTTNAITAKALFNFMLDRDKSGLQLSEVQKEFIKKYK